LELKLYEDRSRSGNKRGGSTAMDRAKQSISGSQILLKIKQSTDVNDNLSGTEKYPRDLITSVRMILSE
jgi:hypothetical protein